MLLLFLLAVCPPFLHHIKLLRTCRVDEMISPRTWRLFGMLSLARFRQPAYIGEMFSCEPWSS